MKTLLAALLLILAHSQAPAAPYDCAPPEVTLGFGAGTQMVSGTSQDLTCKWVAWWCPSSTGPRMNIAVWKVDYESNLTEVPVALWRSPHTATASDLLKKYATDDAYGSNLGPFWQDKKSLAKIGAIKPTK